MSKIRNVSTFFSQNITPAGFLKDSAFTDIIDSDYIQSAASAGLTIYDSIAQLPLTGVAETSLAYIDATNNYYINNGSGWFTISNVNNSLQLFGPDSGQLTATDTIFNFSVIDSDGPYVLWNYALDSNANDILSGVVNDSNGTFTLTYDSASVQPQGVFTATASDTVNLATKNITIIPANVPLIPNFAELQAAGVTSTSGIYTLFKFTNSSYTLQTAGVSGISGYMAVIGAGGAGATFYYGGGAGGGAVIYNPGGSLTIPDDTWTFSIGAGGIGVKTLGTPTEADGGGATTMTGASTGLWADAKGGQGGIQGWTSGGTYSGASYNGGSGSGGGEQKNNTAPSLATYAGTTPSGFTLYRSRGGNGTGSGAGGGGGGAGGAGQEGNTTIGSGDGGNGLQMTVFESLEASSGASDGGYFAAGGGGVYYLNTAGSPGLGGAGLSQSDAQAVTAATNYGSAGGSLLHTGAAGGTTNDAGDGFQGAVFFAIPTALLS